MSKVLGVVAGVALLATGVGAIAGAAVLGTTVAAAAATVSILTVPLATIATIGTIAGIAANLVGAIEGGPAPPARAGVTNSFVIDPQAGIPYVVGRTGFGGRCVHRRGYGGSDNPYYTYVIEWSGGGPIDGFESFQADGETVTFSGGNAVGYYHDFMYFSSQLGATPESSALTAPFGGFPLWGSAYKMSGHAAYMYTTVFDKDGKVFASGQPEPRCVGRGVKVYDPRLDSTYPGGSGSCRALVESTYVYSENGPLHGLTWLLGRWQNGKKVLGVGSPVTELDIAAFVDAANTSDANNWKIGAALDGSADKWNNLKLMLQAGAAEPMDLGGYISCFHERPRTSIATIGPDDLAAGKITLPAMRTMRVRINGIIPRYRSEANNWQIVPATLVRSSTYLAEDGGEEKTREQEYGTVQDATHASQLAAYDIANGREADGIVLPLKLRWIGYRPGDCVTINLPEDGINNLKVIIRRRALDAKTGTVTLTFRTETDAKHPFALGLTGSGPPSATVISGETNDTVVDANDTATAGPPGTPGADGTPAYVHFAYSDAADGLVNFTTGAPGSRTYIGVYTDANVADSTNPALYSWSLIKGADGANGTPGADGSPSYVHIAYSTAADGSTGFSTTDPTSRTYIGVYTDSTLADSTNPTLYAWSLIKGADGAPGVSAKTLSSAADTVTLNAEYGGAIKGGQLGSRANKCTFKDGDTDVSATTTWSRVDSDVTTTISSTGNVVITAFAAEGFTTVTGTYSGVPLTKVIRWNKQDDPAPPQSVATDYIGGSFTVSSTSYAGTAGTGTASANASGVLKTTVYVEMYPASGTGSCRMAGYVAYRVAGSGGAWTAFSGSPSFTFGSNISGENVGTLGKYQDTGGGFFEPFPGYLSFVQTTSGLTANGVYEISFFYRKYSGSTTGNAYAGITTEPA